MTRAARALTGALAASPVMTRVHAVPSDPIVCARRREAMRTHSGAGAVTARHYGRLASNAMPIQQI